MKGDNNCEHINFTDNMDGSGVCNDCGAEKPGLEDMNEEELLEWTRQNIPF